MKQRGIKLDIVLRNIKGFNGREYDIVGVNGEYVVIVEVKNKLTKADLSNFTKKQLPSFKEAFPDYRGHKVIGCVAGLIVDYKIESEADKLGLFVMTQQGEDGAAIANKPDFKPAIF